MIHRQVVFRYFFVYQAYPTRFQKWHITLQVTDVLAVAIKELRSNSSNRQNVVEENSTKGKA